MYIIGILIGLYLQISIVFLCLVIFIICIIICLHNINKRWLVFLCILLIGCMHIRLLNKNYEQKYSEVFGEIHIKAIVISEPADKDYKYIYTIKVEEINNDDKYENTKLILDIKKNSLQEEMPKFGDEIEIIGEFEKPNVARNYKGFDYRNYLKSKKIYGTVTANKYKVLRNNKIDGLSNIINSIQSNMKENINKVLNEEEAALCIGILVGDREAISEQTEDNFKKSNLTHMLAVSGSHITYIVNALSILLGKTNRKFAKIFTIGVLIFFMALTGFTASVMRACIMGILVLLASITYRKADTINNLGISSFIIIVSNPYAIIDVGFLLSYGGTIGIVLLGDKTADKLYYILSKITKGKINFADNTTLEKEIDKNEENIENRKIKIIESNTKLNQYKDNEQQKTMSSISRKIIKYLVNSFSITLSANFIIIPIMAYSFSTISFTFWISNILAAPIMEIVTIFGFIVYFISIIFIPLAQFLGTLLNFLLSLLLKIAEISSLIPCSNIYIKTPYIIECIIYYFLLFSILKLNHTKRIINKCIIILKKSHKLILCIGIIIIIFSCAAINITPKTLKIYFVDVGQGDCTLIKTPSNKNILIDGGGSEFGNFDVGESTLLPYLLDRRVTKIDYMLISHFDSDHIGGLFTVIQNLRVKNIIIPKQGKESDNLTKFKKVVKNKKINVIVVEKGDYIQVDKYSYLEILFPEEKLINDNILNNNSIVARFNSLGLKMLFTGDIEEIAENRLYELYKNTDKLNANILKVAHHGSKTSSTVKFLELVKPKIVFIGVGENNNFGHPNSEVLDRISIYTNNIYRTDKNGEIELTYSTNGIKINKMFDN